MSVIFVGGERHDFDNTNGLLPVSLTAGHFRPERARCAVGHGYGVNGGTQPFVHFADTTLLWFGARLINVPNGAVDDDTWTGDLLMFQGEDKTRLVVRAATHEGMRTLDIFLDDGDGGTHVLAEGEAPFDMSLGHLCVYISYQFAGQMTVYQNGLPIVNYVGNVLGSAAEVINGVILNGPHVAIGSMTYYSEVVVTDGDDTRTMQVQTLTPNAFGDLNQWSGSVADVDEIIPDSADVLTCETAGQQTGMLTTGIPDLTPEHVIRAVKVVGSAAKTAGGPTRLGLGVRQTGTSVFVASEDLADTYGPFSTTMQVNPVTGASFTPADIPVLQLAFQALA